MQINSFREGKESLQAQRSVPIIGQIKCFAMKLIPRSRSRDVDQRLNVNADLLCAFRDISRIQALFFVKLCFADQVDISLNDS